MIQHTVLTLETSDRKADFFNIREDVLQAVAKSGIKNGLVNVQTPHTTCSVFFEEMVHDYDFTGDEFLQVDLNHGLTKLFPKQESENYGYRYPGPLHQKFGIDNDGDVKEDLSYLLNADAHLKSTLIGASETFAVIDGEVQTGKWGYIYFVDWDTCRARTRKCIITVMGE